MQVSSFEGKNQKHPAFGPLSGAFRIPVHFFLSMNMNAVFLLLFAVILNLLCSLVCSGDQNPTDEALNNIKQRLSELQSIRRNECGNWLESKYSLKSSMPKSDDKEVFQKTPLVIGIPSTTGKYSFHLFLFALFVLFLSLGMSDRIAGLVTNFLISLVTKRNFVYYVTDFSTDVILHSYDLPYIPVVSTLPKPFNFLNIGNINHRDRITLENHLTTKPAVPPQKYFLYDYMYEFDLIEDIRKGKKSLDVFVPDNSAITILRSHLSLVIGLFQHPLYKEFFAKETNGRLTAENGFGCLFDFLFQPKPEIFLPIYNEFMSFSNPQDSKSILKIGIHLRAGDDVLNHHAAVHLSEFTHLFRCAEDIEKFAFAKSGSKYSKAVWYVISDNREFRDYALQKYGSEKILTTTNATILHGHSKIQNAHRKHHNIGDEVMHSIHVAAAEWWTYSLADYHVGYKTGFATAAASRLPYKNNLYVVKNSKQTCSENSYFTLDQLKSYFPGI
jgi:hypothetical protein